jgi:hypothetical protein
MHTNNTIYPPQGTPVLKCLALRNQKNRYFIVTKQNYFDQIQVPYVMLDSGCNTHLLPLTPGQIQHLASMYQTTTTSGILWQLSSSGAVGEPSCTLKISRTTGFQATFGLYHDEQDSLVSHTLNLPYLQFHLCRADARELFNMAQNGVITALDYGCYQTVQQFENEIGNISQQRRTHALFGSHG